jgi:hypothetical protein
MTHVACWLIATIRCAAELLVTGEQRTSNEPHHSSAQSDWIMIERVGVSS